MFLAHEFGKGKEMGREPLKGYEYFKVNEFDAEVDYLLASKQCHICKKEFCGLFDWKNYVYQRKKPVRFYCSWSCYRKDEKGRRNGKKRNFI